MNENQNTMKTIITMRNLTAPRSADCPSALSPTARPLPWTLPLALAVFLTACVPSVNPFYTESDLVSDPRLLGEWLDKETTEQPQIWKFEKAEGKKYKLIVTEKEGKRGEFEASLFRLKQDFFLDLRPTECNYAPTQADLIAAAMIPGHLLVSVPQFEPELKLALLDLDWLQKYLEKNPAAVAHQEVDKHIFLTASTTELQRFILQHLAEGEAFAKPGEMIRKTK